MASPGRLERAADGRATATLPPEVEEGNVEYKRKLVDPTVVRYNRLVSQLKWRLSESPHATAVYELGVDDNGTLRGLSESDMAKSLRTLERMAADLDAHVSLTRHVGLPDGGVIAEAVIRRVSSKREFVESRVAFIGGSRAGKSTLLGVLTSGALDNGRGKARLSLLCHAHERQSGRTARVCREIIGFDSSGALLNYGLAHITSWQHITQRAEAVVSFMDLAGSERHLRSTVAALGANPATNPCLVVSARTGLCAAARMHLRVASALGQTPFVVVTHCDSVSSAHLSSFTASLSRELLSFGDCIVIESAADVARAAASPDRVVLMFHVSNTTGRNLNLLMSYLKMLAPPAPQGDDRALDTDGGFEMQIQEVYQPGDVGYVVGGTVLAGRVAEGDVVQLGPCVSGLDGSVKWLTLRVFSIHRLHLPVGIARRGESVSIAFDEYHESIVPSKGAYLVSQSPPPVAGTRLDVALDGSAGLALRVGAHVVVHQGALGQQASVVSVDDDGESVRLRLRLSKPVLLRAKDTLLLRQGHQVVVPARLLSFS